MTPQQESFWQIHKEVFDKHYKKQYLEAGLLEKTRGELQHLISDAATMQVGIYTHLPYTPLAYLWGNGAMRPLVSIPTRPDIIIIVSLMRISSPSVLMLAFMLDSDIMLLAF